MRLCYCFLKLECKKKRIYLSLYLFIKKKHLVVNTIQKHILLISLYVYMQVNTCLLHIFYRTQIGIIAGLVSLCYRTVK